MKKWKTLDSKLAFDNPWFKVRQDKVELPSGKVLDDYFVYLKGHGSVVVPVTKDNELIMVRQYRHAAGELMIELPAGFINEGETPLESVTRELKEETGYAGKIEPLTKFHNDSAKVDCVINVFLATDLKEGERTQSNDDEEIEVMKIHYKKVLEMIDSGEIWAADAVAAIFVALRKLNLH